MEFTKYELELYKKWVTSVEYRMMGRKTMVALLTTEQGFEIVGKSACVNLKDFDANISEDYALRDALRQLGAHVAFHRQATEG